MREFFRCPFAYKPISLSFPRRCWIVAASTTPPYGVQNSLWPHFRLDIGSDTIFQFTWYNIIYLEPGLQVLFFNFHPKNLWFKVSLTRSLLQSLSTKFSFERLSINECSSPKDTLMLFINLKLSEVTIHFENGRKLLENTFNLMNLDVSNH